MPSINANFNGGSPLLNVFIGVSAPRQKALAAAGQPEPAMVSGIFLVDTGATSTVVDPSLILPLGIPPTGKISTHTPSTNGVAVSCDQYDIRLFIPGADVAVGWLIEELAVMEMNLAAQGIVGLIGRDVLERAHFVYNRSANLFTLSY